MSRAVALAMRAGARIAAHPSYPDRQGFGRKSMRMPLGELEESVRGQCNALQRAAELAGGEVAIMKPHGALYHDVARDPAIAEAVLDGALQGLQRARVEIVGFPGSALLVKAGERGLQRSREGFADRAYREDGSLVPRGERGALIEEPSECAAQALLLARSGAYETLCVHADTPGSLRIAIAVRTALESAGLLDPRASSRSTDPGRPL